MDKIEQLKQEVNQKIETLEKILKQKILTDVERIKKAESLYVQTNQLDSTYDITYWKDELLFQILSEILDGQLFFFKDISLGKAFPIGNFNNVKKVFAGLDHILYINKKSLAHFTPELIFFIKGHKEVEN
jgi:hypothetical protein